MNTSTILRQCMHELQSAYDEACMEYGRGSKQADLIADALTFMRDWLRHYAALHTDVDTHTDVSTDRQ